MPPTTAQLLEPVLGSPDLSRTSKQHYSAKAHQLCALTGRDLHQLLLRPGETLEQLAGREPQTLKTFLTTVKTVLKHNPALAETVYRDARAAWTRAFREVHDRVEARYLASRPSPRQADAFVPWPEVATCPACSWRPSACPTAPAWKACCPQTPSWDRCAPWPRRACGCWTCATPRWAGGCRRAWWTATARCSTSTWVSHHERGAGGGTTAGAGANRS